MIGEAARHVPSEFRQAHLEVSWRGMTGMRDKVIHDYFGVDATVVWQTVHEDCPSFSPFPPVELFGWFDGQVVDAPPPNRWH